MSIRSNSSTLLRMVPLVLGLLGLVGFVVAGALAGYFMAWHFLLGALSLVSIVGSLLWIQDVNVRESLSSLVYTIFFVLCVCVVYLIAANRPQRFDLTRDSVHTLTDQTVAQLKRIPDDHTLVLQVFANAKDHGAVQRFVESYRRLAPQLKLEVYDPARDLDVVARLGVGVEVGQTMLALFNPEGELIRKADGRLDATDSLRENNLTNAIARVLQEQQETIYWSVGYGEKRFDDSEESLSQVVRVIAASAVEVKEIRIMEGRIPENATGLVIAGPKKDLSNFDLELLINYLDEGGKLFLLLDPLYDQKTLLPNFELLLRHLGIDGPNSFVVDPLAVTQTQMTLTPQVAWLKHPIANATGQIPFLLDRSRSFRSEGELPQGIRLEAILVSNEQCWNESPATMRSFRRPVPPDDPAEVGVQILSLSAVKDTRGGRWGNRMKVVVVGDSDAFINSILKQNGDAGLFFVQAVNWLRERSDLLQVPPRFLTATPIFLTTTKVWMLLGTFLLIGLAITLGGTAWSLARRRLK